ncbi:fimbrial protein [Achromobacter sp. NPDC058515]|uniref:fimbrial protein n=1 Tax=Achromobacter sp. NPDC058515 TaxID=3346533 RepID=UPI00366335F8
MKAISRLIHFRCRSLARTCAYASVAALAMFSLSAEATVQNCSQGAWNVMEKWVVIPPAAALKNGDVVARQQATLNLGFTVVGTDTLYAQGSFPNNFSFDQAQRATVLPTIPGLGLRVTYVIGSVTPGGVLGMAGDGIVRPAGSLLSMQAMTAGIYAAALSFRFELVVINAAAYNGGTLGMVDGLTSVGITFSSDPSGLSCNLRPIANPVVSLPGSPPPVLPPPASPTCAFTTETLNQSVRLNPVGASMVAANQSAREAGAMSEKPFAINATNCDKNARFRVYFTDSSNQGNTGQTLAQNASSSSRNQVGIRIYYDNQTTPINFGPAPTGAAAGANYVELSAGSTAGVSVAAPFTAQYVANPGVSPSQITGGHVEAEAIVTIVYP